MLDFVKRAFRGGLNVILWINLLLSTVGGGVAGYYLGQLISYRNAGGYAFGGVLIGIIWGLLTDIVGGGFITTILSIERNAEIQTSILKQTIGKDIPVEKIVVSTNNFTNEIVTLDYPTEVGAYFIVTNEKRLVKEKSLFAEVVKYMQKGTKIKVLSEHDDSGIKWLYVETMDGEKGYCVKGDINPA